MRAAPLAAALLSLAVLAPTGVHAQLARPKIDTVGSHVVRVMNPGPTAWADTNGWKLVLERTIQPKEGQPGELATPATVLRTSQGQYIIGDFQAPSVTLFGSDGRFVRQLGRSGEGPGEYRVPVIGLFRDTLLIHDIRLGRVTLMALDGRSIRSFPARTTSCCEALQVDGNGRIRIPTFGRGGVLWNFYNTAGVPLDSVKPPVIVPPLVWRFTSGGGMGTQGIPFGPFSVYLLRRDGTIVHGSTGSYQLHLSRGAADTIRIFGRTGVTGSLIPSALRDSMFQRSTAGNPPVHEVAKLSDVPRVYPLWSSLHEDAAGNTWILADGSPAGPHRFDVFAADGRFLGSVALPFPGTWVSVLGDRVAVIGTDANDLPIIRIYRIDHRGK